MTTVSEYKVKRMGHPFKDRTLFLEGYGISIKINAKKLEIRNGKEEEYKRIEIRNGDYNLYQESYFTEISNRAIWNQKIDRIVISGSGYITFDALHWLTQLGISVMMLDKKGNLDGNLNYVGGNGFPLLRKNQYSCFDDIKKILALQKWVISHKITNEIALLRELGSYQSSEWIENRLAKLPYALKPTDIEVIEARSADMYFSSLAKLPYTSKYGFRHRIRGKNGEKNEADNVINSLFNYGYTILYTIIAKELNAIGLDCSIGFMHKPYNGFYPLIWDMMEAFRDLIDRPVLSVAMNGINENEYSLEREEILFSYPSKVNHRFKKWLVMKSELQKRLIKEIDIMLMKEHWVKANQSATGRKTEQGFQSLKQSTIIRNYCFELRDYILERKKSLSQPQKILSR